jgi:hypothetical protein
MPYDLPSSDLFTRPIEGRDNVDHLITMPGWYWNSLDWLDAETRWDRDHLVRVGYALAENAVADGYSRGDFHADLTVALKNTIALRIRALMVQEDWRHAAGESQRRPRLSTRS